MSEKVFAEGIYWDKPHENAPDFVLGRISINPNKLIPWLEAQKPNEAGYIKVSVLTSKSSGKPYCELDTWEPNQQRDSQQQQRNAAQAAAAPTSNEDFSDEIPF